MTEPRALTVVNDQAAPSSVSCGLTETQFEEPGKYQGVTIAVNISSSSSVFRRPTRKSQPLFQLVFTARIKESSQPNRSVTFDGWQSIFSPRVLFLQLGWARRGGGPLIRVDRLLPWHPPEELEFSGVNYHWDYATDFGPDLRNDPKRSMVTVPADGTLVVPQNVPWGMLWENNESMEEEDLSGDGELWSFRMDDYVMFEEKKRWWCWGDLNDDLKEKTLFDWVKVGERNGNLTPTQEQFDAGYVVSEPYGQLRFEVGVGETSVMIGG